MTAIELFAGVGGFRLGLQQAGIKVIWANEWDKYACDTYDKNFGSEGHAIDRRDLTTIPVSDIPKADIICGGFPCQAFSIAGKRRGFQETRGTLFFEIMRIARAQRTPYLFLENVKGLLNHDGGHTFETIIRTLDQSGYDCQWQVLNSKDFGVPQNRERVFIVGHLRDRPRPQVFPIGEGSAAAYDEGSAARHVARALVASNYKGGKGSHVSVSFRGRDGGVAIEARDDDLAGALRTAGGGQSKPFIMVPEATEKGYAIAEPGDSINLSVPNSTTRRGRVGKGVAQHTLTHGRIRRLTPIECERLQGFPDDWTAGQSDTQRYKQMGNAVTVNVIAAIAEKLAEVSEA